MDLSFARIDQSAPVERASFTDIVAVADARQAATPTAICQAGLPIEPASPLLTPEQGSFADLMAALLRHWDQA